jgi:uncharacterized membrane protein
LSYYVLLFISPSYESFSASLTRKVECVLLCSSSSSFFLFPLLTFLAPELHLQLVSVPVLFIDTIAPSPAR